MGEAKSLPAGVALAAVPERGRRAAPARVGRALRRSPLVAVGGAILLAVVLACALAPFLTAADPVKPSFSRRLQPPWGLGGRPAAPLGTDNLGRDIWARLLHGGSLSLALAGAAVVLAAGAGIAVGLVAGCTGGRLDDVVMRLADVQLAFPVIMLAIAIVAAVGTSKGALVGVLALSGWVLYARTIRADVLTIRGLEYVEAARTLGASDGRVILRHILPNTLAPILVLASSQFATMVLLESGLSFLGLGIQPPQPSWGAMLAEGRDYLSNAWWLATVPGLAISLVVLGANLLGDGLRDLADPRLRR
jgi:peptide/nickel transport system permease protein